LFPLRETELSIQRLIREYTYEFGKSDVSRVKGFCPIPQQWLFTFQANDHDEGSDGD
jgi:hypothetical protein